jgi:C-terminal processing protease CtpA/Prc
MRKIILLNIVLFVCAGLSAQSKFQKDFQFYWQTVNDNFAYFQKQKINWEKVKTIYAPAADTVTTKNGFIHLLETADNELYNGHVFLNTNRDFSNRVIPTGADLKVKFLHNNYIISETRPGFNADLCGLNPGMTVTMINGVPVSKAVHDFLPRSATAIETPMLEYAANMLLAGTHDTKREITVRINGKEKTFYPDSIPNKTESNYTALLESRLLENNIGYIRIDNSLGNSDLIGAFDSVLNGMMNTNGLILDLRETPSGGTSDIARAIMGRFITKELPYQKHIYIAEEKESGIRRSTLELVSPRLKVYSKPLVILVSYWTGSMSEGMAIGFDAMKRGKIAGTKMAGLLGEIYSFETPELKIPFSFPCVQLQHVNGQPREDYIPPYHVTDQKKAVEFALKLLKSK